MRACLCGLHDAYGHELASLLGDGGWARGNRKGEKGQQGCAVRAMKFSSQRYCTGAHHRCRAVRAGPWPPCEAIPLMACTVLVVMGGAVLAGAMCAVCGCLSAACGVLSRMRTRRPARAQQGVRVQQRERGGHPITAQSGYSAAGAATSGMIMGRCKIDCKMGARGKEVHGR